MGNLVHVSKTANLKDVMMKDLMVRGLEFLIAHIGDNYYV
jgi:hypothetical protein